MAPMRELLKLLVLVLETNGLDWLGRRLLATAGMSQAHGKTNMKATAAVAEDLNKK